MTKLFAILAIGTLSSGLASAQQAGGITISTGPVLASIQCTGKGGEKLSTTHLGGLASTRSGTLVFARTMKDGNGKDVDAASTYNDVSLVSLKKGQKIEVTGEDGKKEEIVIANDRILIRAVRHIENDPFDMISALTVLIEDFVAADGKVKAKFSGKMVGEVSQTVNMGQLFVLEEKPLELSGNFSNLSKQPLELTCSMSQF